MKIEKIEIDYSDITEFLLSTLQKSDRPISLSQMVLLCSKKFKLVNEESIRVSIEVLKSKGYDIKEIIKDGELYYSLVRNPITDEEQMYRSMGDIATPILLTSDLHFGSKSFCRQAFDQLVEDVDYYNVNDVMIAGDLIQSRGVYPSELDDLEIFDITEQITGVTNLLSKINANVHFIAGNHENKLQGSVEIGLDPLRLVASKSKSFHYYGHVANLTLNDRFSYMMIHGSGGVTTATTYMIEKIWKELLIKPNILHTGHTHQSAYVRKGDLRYLIQSGTLQRTNAFLIQKGWNAKISWFIVRSISSSGIDIVERTPIYF